MTAEAQRRIGIMVGLVHQLVAMGLTPSSAFLVAGHLLRDIEQREGSLGAPNERLAAAVLGMTAGSSE